MRLEALQSVAIAVSQERSLELVLNRIVQGLAGSGGIALTRIWLIGPANKCEVCRRRGVSPDKVLHLAASAGRSIRGKGDWSRLDGEFHYGGEKVAEIAATSKPVLISQIRSNDKWIEKRDWKRAERIKSFAGHPLTFRAEQLGVIAVFSRAVLREKEFEWLRLFAVAAAVAIANSRAFDEIDGLRQRLETENEYLREEVEAGSGAREIIATSALMHRMLEQIEVVAPTDATVLISGETGVGKELVAHAIHRRSPRRERPLIKVNCTAIPRELFESEFFGHVKGAFSGALRDRFGRFQLADGGSLLLDEIGDLPLEIQPKLLRVLQDGEFEAVGDEKTRHTDVRIIAASNRDLKDLIREGRFREDLYYRLSVFPIEVPPLRERKEDISLLASYFIRAACDRFKRGDLHLTDDQVRQLENYDWPGNVRELQNVVERTVIRARHGSLRLDLPEATESDSGKQSAVIPDAEMKRRESENVAAALRLSKGRIYGRGGAAELLGIKPTTLAARIKTLGLKQVT